MVRRVGIIGYGRLGKYLLSQITNDKNYELAFIWNRTKEVLDDVVPSSFILDELVNFESKSPDLVVEVAHPSITRAYGRMFLKHCDYMIGSPTALCDEDLSEELRAAATHHGLYVPSGAFWGGEDIRKMSEGNQLQGLHVTMRKHPLSLKLEGHLQKKNAEVNIEPVILYHGPVRDICAMAPNNTNTMAVAAIAAPDLGFDGVVGCLVSDPNLTKCHIVEVEAFGFPKEDGNHFHVLTIRKNPAVVGQVTGEATFVAYYGSLKRPKEIPFLIL